jgi:hypothetical protein
VLRRTFGPKSDELTGDWRKLHNEELNDLYSSTNMRLIKLRMRWAGRVACLGEGEVYTGFWWGIMRSLGRPRRRREDNY